MLDPFFFTIIVPVYKVEKYLEECLNSVIEQDFKDYEIILIDDGSPDKSPMICDEYAKEYDNISVLHKQNEGLSAARNDGVLSARGKYIIFLDSDDKLADKYTLLNLYRFITETNSRMIYCPMLARFSDDYSENFPKILQKNNISFVQLYKYVRSKKLLFCAQLFIIEKSLFDSRNIYFYKGIYHEDMDWIPRLFTISDVISIFNKPYYLYRNNPESIVNNYNQKRFDSVCQIITNLNTNEKILQKKKMHKIWLNQNLYCLFCDMRLCKKKNYTLYENNVKKLISLYTENLKDLDLRNKIVYFAILKWDKFFK